jgi:phage tail sheath gpL-like
MSFNSNSIAAVNAVGVKNEQFKPSASVLPRKILIFGTYNPAKTSVINNIPVQVLSPEDAGDRFGFGYMVQRLVKQAFAGGDGTPVYVTPQDEAGGAVAATGQVNFTVSSPLAGTLNLYIAGERYPVTVTTGITEEALTDACVAVINAVQDCPVIASKVAVTFELKLDAKSKGTWGNKIDISFNWGVNEVFPSGVSAVVTAMATGAGIPSIATALINLGEGDSQNEDFYTDVVTGYGQDTTTLDALSTYNGVGNDFVGNYSKTVARPLHVHNGDTVEGSAGLAAQIVITDTRLTDRTNGVVSVPGSPNHPDEIAAMAIGVMAKTSANRAEESVIDKLLPGIIPGLKADRWSDNYDNRNTAVLKGISPTVVKSGAVYLQNFVSYYRPASVPVDSNAFRSKRNISIIQNMLNAKKVNYAQEKWQGISIVSDVQKVGDVESRKKARDTNSVLDDEVFLAEAFENKAWIFTATFTISQLKIAGAIAIRAGALGFDVQSKYILSGEGGILNNEILVDTSLAILA